MIKLKAMIISYAKNLFNLLVVCLRVFFYGIVQPKKLFKLMFSFLSIINKFYQVSHGKLYNFEDTLTFQNLKKEQIFTSCNFYNLDSDVMHPIEVHILAALVCYFKPKTMFEIGTYNGLTSLHFARNSSEDAVIYTLDLPPNFVELDMKDKAKLSQFSYDDMLVTELSKKYVNRRTFHNTPYEKKIVELFGNSMHFDFSPHYGKIDLIFIDGSHSYDYVKSDTENAFKMLSKNGIIVWHDYDYIIHKDLFKYLNSLVKEYKIYSIPDTRFAIYSPRL